MTSVPGSFLASCEDILDTAHSEIRAAESLIETICDEERGDGDILHRDLDTNIARLQHSQDQIAEVLTAFHHLKTDTCSRSSDLLFLKTRSSDLLADPSAGGGGTRSGDDVLSQIRRHSSLSAAQQQHKYTLYDNKAASHHHRHPAESTSNTQTMKDASSECHSDSEFSPIQSKRSGIFGSFGKGTKGSKRENSNNHNHINKSKSFDLLSSDTPDCVFSPKLSLGSEDGSPQHEDSHSLPLAEDEMEDPFQPRHQSAGHSLASADFADFDSAFEKSVEVEQEEPGDEEEEAGSLQPGDRKILYIAKEIMTSEKVYVDVLKLLNIDFRNFIQDARRNSKSQIIPTEQFLKIFSNLPEIMMLNSELLRDFEDRVQNWTKYRKISDIIVKKGPYLKLYTTYVQNYSTMTSHFEASCERWPKFRRLVREFEQFPQCRNLKLSHYLLKPIQRLPQYKLLLEVRTHQTSCCGIYYLCITICIISRTT